MIKKIFINGLKAFLPIAVTFALLYWIFQSIETFFGSFIKSFFGYKYYFDGLGFIVGVALVFAIGILVNAWIINIFYKLFDATLKKIPLIKNLYSAAIEFIDFFDKGANSKPQQAVLVDTQLGKVVGFITCKDLEMHSNEFFSEDEICVYIPLSYQIGGLMIITHYENIRPLDISIKKAMSMVLTAGMIGKQKK